MTTQPVRLGKSGLKVSRLILGCMSYGTPDWQSWVLGEEEGITQIKFACVYFQGPETRLFFPSLVPLFTVLIRVSRMQFGIATKMASRPSTRPT
jgi:hypothetical protein